jgi:hypothetical protein
LVQLLAKRARVTAGVRREQPVSGVYEVIEELDD